MSTREQLIKARLGMLALAIELKNIAKACKLAGVSRSHFYEIKKAYKTFGKDGLAPRVRRKPRMPNHTPPDLEQQILAMTEQHPSASYIRLADQLKTAGVEVTASMVRYVWQRHGLTTRVARLLWLERRVAADGVSHTERPKRLLEVADRNGAMRSTPCKPMPSASDSIERSGTSLLR
ncbi:MAG: helix-turn-helix domain-containing protein [Nitrospiraceae bacterium]